VRFLKKAEEVETLNEYRIPFIGLSQGDNLFQYELDQRFFENYEQDKIKECNFKVALAFDKKETFFTLIFDISGAIKTRCDRCADSFDFPIQSNFTVFVKFGEEPAAKTNDDVIYISPEQTHLDISDLLYEFIVLSIPIQKIHPRDEDGKRSCNEEAIKWLENNMPSETQKADPRWSKLKDLNIKDS
jgi:uncharacterized metal-binding protein YceD (DUF177 family)